MVAITNTNIVTDISKEHTGIRTGVIQEDNNPGMLLLVDTEIDDDPIIQLQFNKIEDVEYLEEKLKELKRQMELIKNG